MKLGAYTATLENLDEDVVQPEEPIEAAETATETAELGGELQAEEAQIEGVESGIEDAGVAAGQIDELTTIAEDSLAGEGETVEEGEVGEQGEGLSEGEANMIEISHETIMNSIGFTVDRRRYTAESFGDARSKREVTLEALDKLKESAGKIKDNVIRALKAAFEAVVGFVAKLLANRSLLEKHLKNLEARVNAVTTDTRKSETLSAGVGMLSLNGAADASSAMKVIAGADQILGVAKKVAELLYIKRDAAEDEELAGGVQAAINALPKNGDGQGILGGDKAFKTNLGGGNDGDGVASNAGFTLEVIDAGKTAESIKAPSKQEMQGVIRAALSTLSHLREAEKIRSRLQDFVKAVENTFNRGVGAVQAKVGTEASKAAGATKRDGAAAAAVGRKVMTKFMTTAFSNAFKVVKASADYVQAGLKNLGEAGEGAAAGGGKPALLPAPSAS